MPSQWESVPQVGGQYQVARDAYIGNMDDIRAARIKKEQALTQKEMFATYTQNVAYTTYLGNIAFSEQHDASLSLAQPELISA